MHTWTRSGLARVSRYAHTHPWHDACGWRAVRETEKERARKSLAGAEGRQRTEDGSLGGKDQFR
eukprot:1220510-Pleurochrysis_carterae.AAC.1